MELEALTFRLFYKQESQESFAGQNLCGAKSLRDTVGVTAVTV
jgi:hypothetical protein